MPEVRLRHFLPALMGSLHQQRADGELVLDQNDGTRRLYWSGGDLRYMRSDAVGEQFGNFLIRRGVLDMASLKELLADGEGARVGDRVVQWGLMTVAERDERLRELLGSVLLHAMEHPILKLTWTPGPLDENLGGDLRFGLDHRVLVWDTFQNAKIDRDLMEMFQGEPDWRWEARPDLLGALSDLPLTPTLAYALSLLGSEPLGFGTICSLTGLPPEDAARLVATLWALGGLTLVQGDLPLTRIELLPPALELPGPAGSVPGFDLEPEISLVEEDAEESPESPPASRPMTLMDILEMDAEAKGPEPIPPMGPPPGPPTGGDPFAPRMTPRTPLAFPMPGDHDPFRREAPLPEAPSIPLAPVDPFMVESARMAGAPASAPTPELADFPPFPAPSLPDSGGPAPSWVPPLPEAQEASPHKRAQRLVAQAKTFMAQARTSEATRALEQAIKLDGDSASAYDAWLLLGRLRLANPAWSTRAVEALQVASRLNRNAAEPWILMGELYMRKGYHANARGCFRRALELDPSVVVPSGYQEEILAEPPRESGGGIMGRLRAALGRGKG